MSIVIVVPSRKKLRDNDPMLVSRWPSVYDAEKNINPTLGQCLLFTWEVQRYGLVVPCVMRK